MSTLYSSGPNIDIDSLFHKVDLKYLYFGDFFLHKYNVYLRCLCKLPSLISSLTINNHKKLLYIFIYYIKKMKKWPPKSGFHEHTKHWTNYLHFVWITTKNMKHLFANFVLRDLCISLNWNCNIPQGRVMIHIHITSVNWLLEPNKGSKRFGWWIPMCE